MYFSENEEIDRAVQTLKALKQELDRKKKHEIVWRVNGKIRRIIQILRKN